jgi:hypothetical protein
MFYISARIITIATTTIIIVSFEQKLFPLQKHIREGQDRLTLHV